MDTVSFLWTFISDIFLINQWTNIHFSVWYIFRTAQYLLRSSLCTNASMFLKLASHNWHRKTCICLPRQNYVKCTFKFCQLPKDYHTQKQKSGSNFLKLLRFPINHDFKSLPKVLLVSTHSAKHHACLSRCSFYCVWAINPITMTWPKNYRHTSPILSWCNMTYPNPQMNSRDDKKRVHDQSEAKPAVNEWLRYRERVCSEGLFPALSFSVTLLPVTLPDTLVGGRCREEAFRLTDDEPTSMFESILQAAYFKQHWLVVHHFKTDSPKHCWPNRTRCTHTIANLDM